MTVRANRVARAARWALPAALLIGTVICVVNAATDDTDRTEIQELLEQYAVTGQAGRTGGKPGAKAPGKNDATPDDLLVRRLAGRHIFAPARKAAFGAKLQGVLGHLAYFVGNAQGMRVGQAINGAKIKEIGPDWVKVDFKGKETTLRITGGASPDKPPAGRPKAPGHPGRPHPTGANPAPVPAKAPAPVKKPSPPDMSGGRSVPPTVIRKLGSRKGRVSHSVGGIIIINDNEGESAP